MVKWKCKASGNIISLDDTETTVMLKHPGYERVEDGLQEIKETTQKEVNVNRSPTRKQSTKKTA